MLLSLTKPPDRQTEQFPMRSRLADAKVEDPAVGPSASTAQTPEPPSTAAAIASGQVDQILSIVIDTAFKTSMEFQQCVMSILLMTVILQWQHSAGYS